MSNCSDVLSLGEQSLSKVSKVSNCSDVLIPNEQSLSKVSKLPQTENYQCNAD